MPHTVNKVTVDIGGIENSCFVAMPFDGLFQRQYERVIRPAVEELGLKCVRGDEIYSKPEIMADIWKAIRMSRLLIAELTGHNPNEFYEVGLAHAIGKPILLLTRNQEDVPFDLKALRYLYYEVNDPFWGENLHNAIKNMVTNILHEPVSHTYLDGICPRFQIPTLPEPRGAKFVALTASFDISGDWKAEWKRDVGTIKHQGVLYITQEGDQLSATMTVTYERTGIMTVIQEILTGSIQGDRVHLGGASYTYIRQGASNLYHLDNFDVNLEPDGKAMHGEFFSTRGRGRASLTRIH